MNGKCPHWLRHSVGATLLVMGWSGCGSSNDEPSDPPAAESRMDDEPGDREQLLACEVEEPCLPGFAQLADQRPFTITADRLACIFRALGERKPGRYLHETDHTFGDGSQGAQHVLLVRSDGRAFYGSATYEDHNGSEPKEKDRPGQLCTLRDPSYFVDCLDAVLPIQQGDAIQGLAWDCAYADNVKLDWFESCEEAPAACE